MNAEAAKGLDLAARAAKAAEAAADDVARAVRDHYAAHDANRPVSRSTGEPLGDCSICDGLGLDLDPTSTVLSEAEPCKKCSGTGYASDEEPDPKTPEQLKAEHEDRHCDDAWMNRA